MHRLRSEGLVCALFVALLLGPSVDGQLPAPMAPSAVEGTLYATPYAVALDTLERIRGGEDSVPNRPDGSLFLTRDQMLVVLAHVALGERISSLRSTSLQTAHKIWDAAQPAYSGRGWYHVTLDAESVCMQLETNAWALQASLRLGAALGDLSITRRGADVARMLTAALNGDPADGVDVCPAGANPPPSQWPLVLWSLLLYAEEQQDSATERIAVARLRAEANAHLDRGFVDPSGDVRLVAPTAQYLLAMGAAADGGNAFAADREELAAALAAEFIASDGTQLVAYNLLDNADGTTTPTSPDLEASLWAAYALHVYGNRSTQPLPEMAERLLDSLFRRSYSPALGGLVGGAQVVETGLHALVATLTSGALPTSIQADAARIQVAMPAVESVRFPLPGQEGADRVLVSNDWTIRFGLAGVTGTERVLLPLSALGPVNMDFPPTRYTPTPQLFVDGEAAEASLLMGRFPVVEFEASPSGSSSYRLQAYAPVLPDFGRLGRSVQMFFVANGSGEVNVSSLQIDLPMRDVSVFGVSVASRALGTARFVAQSVGPTEFLATDHVRLEVRDVVLSPTSRTEIVINYEDALSPNVTDVGFAHDASQQRPLDEKGDKLRTGPGGEAHVQARVTDNAVVRRVLLVVGQGLNTTEVAMAPDANDPTLFRGVLRGLALEEPTTVRVRAVDEHGNLKESAEYQVQAQSGFLAEGSLIILVFSAVLMGMAAAIYFKMGRKKHGR